MRSRSSTSDMVQALLVALAAVLVGTALILGDVTIPRSPVGGALLVLAGVCWAVAGILKGRRTGSA